MNIRYAVNKNKELIAFYDYDPSGTVSFKGGEWKPVRSPEQPDHQEYLSEAEAMELTRGQRPFPPKAKEIGYLAPQYYHPASITELGPAFQALVEEFRIKAREAKPDWYEKGACVYFMYEGKAYCVGPGTLDSDSDHVACIAGELINALYALGAYEMFYSGMMD